MATIDVVADGDLIETAWGNSVATELNANVVKKTGSTMTGPLFLPAANPTGATQATHKGYVDATTVTISGDVMTGTLNLGGPPVSGNGIDLEVTGHIDSSVVGSTGTNITLGRGGSPAADPGNRFVAFCRGASPSAPQDVVVGSISIVTGGSSVAYNTTSDERLKNVVGDVDDPIGRISQLVPRRLSWKADPTAVFDGFLAHEVQTVAPYAVTGQRGAVLAADGAIDPQQLDTAKLVPLLVAAVQALTARVAALEGVTP